MGLEAAKWFSKQGSQVVMVARNEARPLVDSPFSKAVQSDLKVSATSVIERLIIGIENHEYEIRPRAIWEDLPDLPSLA